MAERELRLTLVCYGGLSLAVYMHGVSKELLKLTRASMLYHRVRDSALRRRVRYEDINDDHERETDSEPYYFALLQSLGEVVDLRVVVDAIAGTSAGGINGVMLARGLAHDLPLDAHRDMWLRLADVTELMGPDTLAGSWAKPYMRPLLWALTRGAGQLDDEVYQKLSRLVRSRWLRPPFSGRRFTAMLLESLHAMGEPVEGRSLLPVGHALSLHVTMTNYHGYQQALRLRDPVSIREREYRHQLQFRYLRNSNGELHSDFDQLGIPGLCFAARATSAYGGLFPPVGLAEVQAAVRARGAQWTCQNAFVAGQFQHMIASGEDPAQAFFIDGGVLNNKPFDAALKAIRGRSAHREVDRRLLFIEPHPETASTTIERRKPSFLDTIQRAFFLIPRSEPIRDELERLAVENEHVHQIREIFNTARPTVRGVLQSVLANASFCSDDPATVCTWRLTAEREARAQSGYAYQSYRSVRLRSLVRRLRFGNETDDNLGAVDEELFNVIYSHLQVCQSLAPEPLVGHDAALYALDVNYRIRRLAFIVLRLNEIYRDATAGSARSQLDVVKASLYALRDDLHAKQMLIGGGLAVIDANTDLSMAQTSITDLMTRLDLSGCDNALDSMFAQLGLPEQLQAELVIDFLGFPFFDVLSFPVARWDSLEELNPVQVDRMSPDEATSIRRGGAQASLKGIALQHTGAFFSRAYRENDYLWGRLHAAERLVDIVLSAVYANGEPTGIGVRDLKQALFGAIVDAESEHLLNIPQTLARIREEIDAMH